MILHNVAPMGLKNSHRKIFYHTVVPLGLYVLAAEQRYYGSQSVIVQI
jgi:hypothetical protein